MVLTMSITGWLKETFSLIVMFEGAAILFAFGILTMVPLMKRSAIVQNEVQNS
jgi:MFS transporter, DHA3 family, macrolide efflux protein